MSQQPGYYPPPPQQPYYPPPPPQQYYPPRPPMGVYSPVPNAESAHYHPPSYEQGRVQNTVAEKWNPRPKFQDAWAAILFLIHFIGFIIISYFGLKSLSDSKTLSGLGNKTDNFPLTSKSIIMLVVTAILGFFLSMIYMLCMRKFPKPLIIITLWLSVATFFVVAIAYGFFKQYVLAVISGIFAIIYLICAISWRDRIPFAAIMLETVTGITKKYYGTIVMGFVGLFLQVGWSAWWVFTIIGAYRKYYSEAGCKTTTDANGSTSFGCDSVILYVVMLYLLFSFYWTSQVIKTIVHVTDSGVFAAFYFLEGTPQGTGSVPTLSSLKRACTTSFGSICFGSLIIAILNTIKAIFQAIANSDDGACGFLAACFACLLSYIEALVEYFNHYAYVEVAIYGKSFCRAAKDTWKLIKDRGVEAIINDNLIGNVLAMGAILIGVLCGAFGYAYIRLANNITNDTTNIVILVVICFLLGLMMTIIITDAIDSGVATTFVALAEDPDALRRTKPELFERIRQKWPRIVQGM
ncbi:7370_t:CDS:2 [Paraglomus brasilianum]|uniref:Protein PNS1 n=1 Tax=Paraglomus brasilianum TaxID=144538 RepID=A0A9N9GF43_9GLOM|nr:7370_t:CDS:2 [Paraglomus brasilianum]